jgi:hypothetical protein
MNACIKTGADVWDTNENGVRYGDLYHVNGFYVLRYVGVPHYDRSQVENDCFATFDTRQAYLDQQRMHYPARLLQPEYPNILDMAGGADMGYATLLIAEQYVKEQVHEND